MIAVSLKPGDGDELVDLYLRKGADVNAKSMSNFPAGGKFDAELRVQTS